MIKRWIIKIKDRYWLLKEINNKIKELGIWKTKFIRQYRLWWFVYQYYDWIIEDTVNMLKNELNINIDEYIKEDSRPS